MTAAREQIRGDGSMTERSPGVWRLRVYVDDHR
jgi:hypothetical protein